MRANGDVKVWASSPGGDFRNESFVHARRIYVCIYIYRERERDRVRERERIIVAVIRQMAGRSRKLHIT